MWPKQLLRAAIRRTGFELRKIQAPPAPFIPYLQRYDLDYGAERRCAFDFWVANRDASQWYYEWFFGADDPVWELRQFSPLVRAGDHVLEIGCHHGFLTMQLAHLVGPHGSIVALDANPENVIIAQANVALNGLRNVTVLFRAGGEQSGEADFEFQTNAHQVKGSNSRSSYRTEVTTADQLAATYQRTFNVIKIDVEGFECEVLRGASNLLRSRPNLLLEVHPEEMHAWHANGSVPELVNLISAQDYSGTIICRPNFADVRPFSVSAIPLDRVSNLHLKPKYAINPPR